MAEDCNSSSLVQLNVGGKKFSTTVDTLTQRQPDSMLAAMFSGRHTLCQDKKGYVFIDRDGEHFRHILNWLRDGEIPELEASQYAELVKEAKYYQLLGLVDGILDVLNSKEDKKLDADFTRAEVIKYIHSRKWFSNYKHYFRGVNLSGLNLSKLDLSDVNFSYACLRGVCFSGANILRCDFNYADAEGATFDNADLRCSTFCKANLSGLNLSKLDLSSVDFSYACLRHVNFSGATFDNAIVKEIMYSSKFNYADAEGATFDNANLLDSTFSEANLRGASFVGAKNYNLAGASCVEDCRY